MPRINLLPWRAELRQKAQERVPSRAVGEPCWSAACWSTRRSSPSGLDERPDLPQSRSCATRSRSSTSKSPKSADLENAARSPAGAHGDHRPVAALASRGRAPVRRAREHASGRRAFHGGEADREPHRAAGLGSIEHAGFGADAQHRGVRMAATSRVSTSSNCSRTGPPRIRNSRCSPSRFP